MDTSVEDDDALGLYRLVVAEGWQPEVLRAALGFTPERLDAAVKLLQDMHLLRRSEGDSGYATVSPDLALADTVAPLKRVAAEADELVVQATTRNDVFRAAYFDARRERNHDEAIDRLTAGEEIAAMVAEQVHSCRSEIFTVQPSPGADESLLAELAETLSAAASHVRVRGVFPYGALLCPGPARILQQMAEAGVEIRTTGEVPPRSLVFDRRIAFLDDDLPGSGRSVVLVREPVVVDRIHQLLEWQWLNGTDLNVASAARSDLDEQVKLSILRLLAEGLKDDVVARRLGMSVRSCRRHIAEMMNQLAASSRFQAGALAQRSGLLG